MSTNINSTEQIVEINAGDQITNVNIVSQSTTQVISGEQVVTVDVNAGTIPAAWGSITGTLSNQTDLQNALNAKQNNITLTTTGTTGVATLVGSTLNIPNYVSSTKQSQWDSAYNDKINSAEVSGTTTKTLTLTQQDGGIIQASWSDFDTAPVTSVFGRTGDVVAAEGDYNINQLGDVTITSATNGQVLKFNGTAWVNAADASGLTSVGLTVPTGLSVSGSPLTSNGTINVGLQSGYSIPTTAKQAEWDQAYNDKINSASVTGNSTKTLTLTQQDGGTVTTSWTDQGLTSVGLAMPSAFTVSGSPLTSNGTITITGAGTTSQYVRGDGSLATFPTTSNEAKTLIREVYNKTGATLTKGTVVYIDGGQGNLPTVTKAIASGDPTSAQTFGIVQSDITNMNNGFVVIAGGIDNLDTQAYTEGTALYLSPTTAGAFTSTKPYAPNHLVYLGVVVRSHPTQGVIEVKIQNGYELDELHNVSARFPTNKDGLFYNSTSNVWENKSIAGVLGYTPVPQSRIITINGTAQDLSADRTWNVGTVTSVSASGGTGISISGSPVTGSGTISIVNTAPDQTVTINPSGLATVSGTYPNFTVGVSTAYSGSVTSVNASVPTGFEVSGVPITTAGTIDIKFASGYSLPTTAKQTQWDDAYTKRINSLTVTGNSGSSTLISNVLNVPTYTLSGLGGEPAITAGTTSQYWRGDKTFQTLNTGVVPESGNVYFTEPRVRATVLSGLNITGGSISASDSVLDAFGKVQNQINGLMGGSIFQSTWNASTNTPTLTSSSGTKGYYYIVSVAGTTNLNGITDWQIGDWAIFDGTVWRKVDNTDAVVSVNGFTGTVSLGISNLADVSASSPTDTQLLRFNGTTSKWYNWTPTYISGNQTITLSGDVTGSGTTAITTSIGTGKVTNAMLAGSINYAKMDAATVPTWNQDTTGNAATADKWKTARTLTIGATGKSVDGSGNVTWSASDIGLTNYLPLAGGTMTGQIILKEGTDSTDYTKGLRFPNDPYGGSGDISGLRLYRDGASGEKMVLELYIGNDSTGTTQDRINFATGIGGTPDNNLVTINGNKIWNEGNLPSPQSSITLTTTGTSGAATFSSNTLNIPIYQSVLTNPVTGTGTNNYIAKFTSTGSTVGDSLLQSTTTGVFINQEDTFFGIDAQALIRLGFTKKSGYDPYLTYAGQNFVIASTSATSIAASNTFTPKLTMTVAGDATFAASVSASTLSATTVTGTNNAGVVGLYAISNNVNGAGIYIDNSTRASGVKFSLLSGNAENGAFSIKDETANVTRFIINSGGNGYFKNVLFVDNTGNSEPALRMRTVTDNYVTEWAIGQVPSATTFGLRYKSATAWSGTIFGVDTTGAATFSNTVQVGNKIGTVDDQGIFLRGIGDSTHKIYYKTSIPANIWEYNADILFQHYNAASPVTRFTFDTSGNFTATRQIISNGASGVNAVIWAKGGADGAGQGKGNFRSSDGGGTNYWDFGRDNLTTGNFVITSGGGSPLVSITTGGNFGISATSPSATLDVGSSRTLSGTDLVSVYTDAKVQSAVTGGLIGYNVRMVGLSPAAGSYTIANMYAIKTNTPAIQTNVTVTNSYGVYIGRTDDPSSGGVVTNKYALVTESAAGNIGLGIVAPTELLHIYKSSTFATVLLENGSSNVYSLYQAKTANSSLWQWGCWNNNTYRLGISGVGDFITVTTSGAATFSSSVKANNLFLGNNQYLAARNAANTADRTLIAFNSSNAIQIGQDTDITALTLGVNSEAMRITSGGHININNTTNTTYQLYVNGTGFYNSYVYTSNEGTGFMVDANSNASQARVGLMKYGGYEGMLISGASTLVRLAHRTDSEYVYGGTPTIRVDLSIAANGDATFSSKVTATSFFESSDIRLKSNIQDYKSTDIFNISAKIYEKDGKIEVGYLAQDLESVLKSAVSIRENGYLDLSYRQVHTAKIAALEAKIKELEAKLK